MSLDAARAKAADIRKRADPMVLPSSGPTLAEGFLEWMKTLGDLDWKSRRNYAITFKKLEGLKDSPLKMLSADNKPLRDLHAELAVEHPVGAAQVVRLVGSIWRYVSAIRDMPHRSPTAGIRLPRPKRRTTFLPSSEMAAWEVKRRALEAESPLQGLLPLWLLLSGLRREDGSSVKWSDFNADRTVLHRPRPKGGTSKAFNLPLSSAMRDVLGLIQAVTHHLDSEYCSRPHGIPSPGTSQTSPWHASG